MKKCTFLLLVIVLSFTLMAQTTSVPPLMNFQGRLSNPDGTAVADGTYKIKFSIYNQATEGTEKWYQVMEPVIVKNGVFAVLLGNGNPLSASVFEGNSYLEIKVGDDSPLTPRQPIVSVGYAFKADSAKEADNALVADTVKDKAITSEKLADGVAIPPGVILMWNGASTNVPAGWVLCDGQNGTPDLRNRFIVGAGLDYLVNATGGEALHTLSIAEMPSHSHKLDTPEGIWNFGCSWMNVSTGGYDGNWGYHNTNPMTTTTGGNQPHENRPPYYALCYIMKLGY